VKQLELFAYQSEAAETIADRYLAYAASPVVTGTVRNTRVVPFFQALAAITASGKTAILAQAVSTVAGALPVKPIILWLSKGKVVVEQTYANLLPSGKYAQIIGNADVRLLAEYDATEVATNPAPFVLFATVGTFNRRERNDVLLIYRSDIDDAEQSTWDALKQRLDGNRNRRPLIVVYDEAHNLSDQQTDLLLELAPDAFLLASATMRLPVRLEREIQHLRENGYDDDTLITRVDSAAVADSGLVKSTVVLSGYRTPMEEAVSALLSDLSEAEQHVTGYGLGFAPKAIYVCNTNIVEGDAHRRDDTKRPFAQRQAPPILIWRYLVEQQGIAPETIAVYCSLAFDRNYPPPPGFTLFRGGDKDYATFSAGNFRHIIFNLSLQEGWDDPACYFAYIDRSMDSRVQVEQIIGRLLRQPGARHYPAERLNSAHFYVRVDRNEVFAEVLDAVDRQLAAEAPQIRFVKTAPGRRPPVEIAPREPRTVPGTALDSSDAVEPIQALLDRMTDYRSDDGTNARGVGGRTVVKRAVGSGSDGSVHWEDFEHSGTVLARWVFTREVRRRDQRALDVAPTAGASFDARVGLGSNAEAHILATARAVVDAYLDNVAIVGKRLDPYAVGPLLVRPDEAERFTHSLHECYDGLNATELAFARALDATGYTWARNPARTGYPVPLVSLGSTRTFYPDFLVWKGEDVFAVETKGAHLLTEAAARKLLNIRPPRGATSRLRVRLLSEGTYNEKAEREAADGYTVWGFGANADRRVWHEESLDRAVRRILRP
jgi:type III restriction enzyme